MTTTHSSPNLNLPQRPPVRARGSGAAVLACVLLLVVIGIQVYALRRPAAAPAGPQIPVAGTAIPAGDLKSIAMKLEDRNLPGSAAEAWRRYLEGSALEPLDRARILYRIGKLEFEAGRYEPAVAELYIAEHLAGGGDAELARQITLKVRECLQKMGRYAELSREMAARAASQPAEAPLTGQQVVAEIGTEKITAADFDRMMRDEIDRAVAAQASLSPQQAETLREQAGRQLAQPEARAQHLQQLVASRVLAAEARDAGFESSPRFREKLIALADELLATGFLAEETGKRATVTPEDVQRYFEANKDKYAEPASGTLAHIVCPTEEAAREVLSKAQAGEDFAALAAQYSTDERTKAAGGKIAQPFAKKETDIVPGIGRNPELAAAIWAVTPGSALAEVYQSDAGWHVVKVLERTESVGRSFDEVKSEVEQDVRAARQREVTQQYLRELFEKRGVKLYPEAFTRQK